MFITLRRVEYKTLCSLTDKEWRTIKKYFPKYGDGTFYVDGVILKEAIDNAEKDKITIPEKVIIELKRAVKLEGILSDEASEEANEKSWGINFVAAK